MISRASYIEGQGNLPFRAYRITRERRKRKEKLRHARAKRN
jgi:hypothetical protein